MHASNPAGAAVLRWILKGRGKAVVSQQLLRELNKTQFGNVIKTLDQAGKICRVDDDLCDQESEKIKLSGFMRSNDPHVLALLRLSGCELIFTHDKLLHEDIKSKMILRASCKIYQTEDHADLLGECRC